MELRRRMMGKSGGSIPYQRIEYLECNGTEFIDLGFHATDNISFQTEIYRPTNDVMFDCGAEDTWTSKIARLVFVNRNITYWRYGNTSVGNNTQIANSNYLVGLISATINRNFYEVTNKTSGITYSNTTTGNTPFETTGTFLLFGFSLLSTKQAEQECAGSRLYFFKVTDTNVNMDLVPVRIDTTGYLYDKVSGELFGNAGTGNFTLGPDIN